MLRFFYADYVFFLQIVSVLMEKYDVLRSDSVNFYKIKLFYYLKNPNNYSTLQANQIIFF